jgi:hypothetical protein
VRRVVVSALTCLLFTVSFSAQADAHIARKIAASATTKRDCCTTGYTGFKTFLTVTNSRGQTATLDCDVQVFNPDGTVLSGVSFRGVTVSANSTSTYRLKWHAMIGYPYNVNDRFTSIVNHCHDS